MFVTSSRFLTHGPDTQMPGLPEAAIRETDRKILRPCRCSCLPENGAQRVFPSPVPPFQGRSEKPDSTLFCRNFLAVSSETGYRNRAESCPENAWPFPSLTPAEQCFRDQAFFHEAGLPPGQARRPVTSAGRFPSGFSGQDRIKPQASAFPRRLVFAKFPASGEASRTRFAPAIQGFRRDRDGSRTIRQQERQNGCAGYERMPGKTVPQSGKRLVVPLPVRAGLSRPERFRFAP